MVWFLVLFFARWCPAERTAGMTPTGEGSHDNHGHASVLTMLKKALFGVFHSMIEKAEQQHRVTAFNQTWAVFLLIIDAVQVLILTLSDAFGWESAVFSAIQEFSVIDLLLPRRDPALFNLVYICTILIVALAVCDAAYVANMFRQNNFKQLWPLKLLRFIVGVIVTAGFVPTFGIVITPFSCSQMIGYNGQDFQCTGGHGITFIVVSIITLALYVPFGLAVSLVLHESDGNSPRTTAKVSGEEAFWGTMAKLIGVVASRNASEYPALSASAMIICYGSLAAFTVRTLPFFHPFMNRFRCAASVTTAYMAVGAFCLSVFTPSDVSLFSVMWPLGALFAAALGWYMPTLRYRALRRRLFSFRDTMLSELHSSHAATPVSWTNTDGSFRSVARGSRSHNRRGRRESIHRLASKVREARYKRAALPLDGGREEQIHAKTIFDGMSAFEVELIVRTELAQAGNVRRSRGAASCCGASSVARVATTAAVEHAMWIFAQAIEEFSDDPRELSIVKIEYARFLQVFTADVNLATAALESASRGHPSWQGEFEVFSRLRKLQQKRQSSNLGADRGMNLIALVEYNKKLSDALDHHERAVQAQSQLFSLIRRQAKAEALEDAHTVDRIGGLVERLQKAAKFANRGYLQLLTSFPNAPHLGNIYAHFCRDVLNDMELASQYGNIDASGTATGSQASGMNKSAASKGSHDTRMKGSDNAFSMRTLLPKSRVSEISFLDTQFKVGVTILLLLAGAMFVTTDILLNSTDDQVLQLQSAGIQRYFTVTAAIEARSLALGMPVADKMRTSMAAFKRLIASIRDDSRTADADGAWRTANIPIKTFIGNSTYRTETANLWDASLRLVAESLAVANSSTVNDLDPSWRFVMDNALTAILPAFYNLIHVLGEAVSGKVVLYGEITGLLMVLVVVTLLFLGCWVYRRAVNRVALIKQGVCNVAMALTQEDVAHMLEKVAKSKAYVAKARGLVSDDGEEASHALALAGYDDHPDLAELQNSLRGSSPGNSSGCGSASQLDVPRLDSIPEQNLPRQQQLPEQQLPGQLPGQHLPGQDVAGKPTMGSRITVTSAATTSDSRSATGVMDGEHLDGLPRQHGAGDDLRLPGTPSPRVPTPRHAGNTPLPDSSDEDDPLFGSTNDLLAALGASQDEVDDVTAITTPTAADSDTKHDDERISAAPDTAPAMAVLPAIIEGAIQEQLDVHKVMSSCIGGVVCTDAIGTVLYANMGCLKLLGHSKRSLVGKNVTIIQPPEISRTHREVMKRVADGGEPRVIGKAGRQVNAIHALGHEIPILLSLSRLEYNGNTFFIAEMQDMRVHLNMEELEHDEAEAPAKGSNLTLRVFAALLFIALLQCCNFVFGAVSLAEIASHSSEIDAADSLRARLSLIAFACRETAIGDDNLWTNAEARQVLHREMEEFDEVQAGLHYGSQAWDLPGSSRISVVVTELETGVYKDGVYDMGMMARAWNLFRDVHSIMKQFNGTNPYAGASVSALDAVPELVRVWEHESGPLSAGSTALTEQIASQIHATTESVRVTAMLISGINVLMVLALYFAVLRRMMFTLVGQAQRTDGLLLALPESLAETKRLQGFFYRTSG